MVALYHLTAHYRHTTLHRMSGNSKKLGKTVMRELERYSDGNVAQVDNSSEPLVAVAFEELMQRVLLSANRLAMEDGSLEVLPQHIETALAMLLETPEK